MGERRWYIIICYHNPDETSTVESVTDALMERPWSSKLLAAGDFNVRFLETEGDWREEEIAAVLDTEVLEYMLAHFLPRRRSWFWDGRTRSMVREGREVRSRTDYILGMDCRIFWNVSVWDPRHN